MPSPNNFTPLIYIGVIALGFGLFLALAGFDIIKVEKVSVKPGRQTWLLGLLLIIVGGLLLNSGGAFKGNDSPPLAPLTTPEVQSTPPEAATEPPPTAIVRSTTIVETPNASPDRIRRQLLVEAKSWDLVMQDGFDSNFNTWDLAAVDDDSSTQTKEISNDVFKWGVKIKKASSPFLEIVPTTVPSDFYYSVRVRRIQGTSDEREPGAWWGIAFRRHSINYYTFLITDKQESWVGRYINENGSYQAIPLIGQTFSSDLKPNEFNTLAVIVEGAHMTFFINDVPVGALDDSTFADGNVGFYVGLTNPDIPVNFEFDDFELRAAP